MPEQQRKISAALETLHQVRQVNNLFQGVCARIGAGELTEFEAQGLWVALEWQNEKVGGAEAIIKTMAVGKAANTHAA